MVLKNPRMTPHIVNVVLNNGWCKSKLDQVWIKYGDFKTGVSHIITPLPNLSDLKFDVKLEKYLDTNPGFFYAVCNSFSTLRKKIFFKKSILKMNFSFFFFFHKI